MASPAGKAVVDQLAALNDELCFFLFVKEEMSRGLRRFSSALDTAFSTDLFSDNPEANRIHITLSELRVYQRVHGSSTYYSYFSTSHEVAATYYSQCEDFLGECGITLGTSNSANSKEIIFGSRIAPLVAVPQEILETLQYMRLRRNHWIHRRQTVQQIWLDLASQRGAALNIFWNTTGESVDFTKTGDSRLEEDEAIALLKLIRICVQKIDDLVMSNVPVHGLLARAARERWGANARPPNSQVLSDRARTLCGIVRHQFGVSVSQSDAEQVLQNV